MSPTTYWAIGLDFGAYEGQKPPITLVPDEVTAKAVCKLFNETYHGSAIYCVEVPIWPEIIEKDATPPSAPLGASPKHQERMEDD